MKMGVILTLVFQIGCPSALNQPEGRQKTKTPEPLESVSFSRRVLTYLVPLKRALTCLLGLIKVFREERYLFSRVCGWIPISVTAGEKPIIKYQYWSLFSSCVPSKRFATIRSRDMYQITQRTSLSPILMYLRTRSIELGGVGL